LEEIKSLLKQKIPPADRFGRITVSEHVISALRKEFQGQRLEAFLKECEALKDQGSLFIVIAPPAKRDDGWKVGEVTLYTNILLSNDIDRLEQYFSEKWAISITNAPRSSKSALECDPSLELFSDWVAIDIAGELRSNRLMLIARHDGTIEIRAMTKDARVLRAISPVNTLHPGRGTIIGALWSCMEDRLILRVDGHIVHEVVGQGLSFDFLGPIQTLGSSVDGAIPADF